MSRNSAQHQVPIALRIAIAVWVFILTCSALRAYIPYVHWYATGALTMALILGGYRPKLRHQARFHMCSSALLCLSVLLVAAANEQPLYNIGEAAKLTLILLFLCPLLAAHPDFTDSMIGGAVIANCIHALLLVLGIEFGVGPGTYMGPGRYTSGLAGPGTLWRTAALVLLFAILRYVTGRWSFGKTSIVLCSSLLLILADGARTGDIMLSIAMLFALFFIVKEFLRTRASMLLVFRSGTILLLLASGIAFGLGAADIAITGARVSSRAADFALSVFHNADIGTEDDRIRSAMLVDGLEAVKTHPLIGSGMGTTKTVVAGSGEMVNHISYLQVWADVGILGFISYLFINLGSLLIWTQRMLREARSVNVDRKCKFYNGVFLLAVWFTAAWLHALSTEMTEWILFVIAYSSLESASNHHGGVNCQSIPDKRLRKATAYSY